MLFRAFLMTQWTLISLHFVPWPCNLTCVGGPFTTQPFAFAACVCPYLWTLLRNENLDAFEPNVTCHLVDVVLRLPIAPNNDA